VKRLIVMLSLIALPAFAQEPVIPVYIVQPSGEFEDQALKDRKDSTSDLAAGLRRKEKTLRLVEDPMQAAITLEVLSRGRVETGALTPRVFGGGVDSERAKRLIVKLSVGSYETEIVGDGGTQTIGAWKEAAGDAARQIDKWIKANRAKLAQ
jgi:hypothetical protein